ncbi:MAG: hypothetical protein HC904_16540 [Blastochloris sp.]|nr:hypothetical protein [Blastochloris sp.]
MFNYFQQNGFLSMSSRCENLINDWDPLAKILFNTGNLVNLIATDAGYRHRQREFLVPRNTDLVAAPAHVNQREDYLEGVSAEMWLGEAFWQYASCTKEDVIKTDWLKVENRESHLHVEAWHEPFTSADGEQGEVQRKLLKLLFDLG